MLKPIKFLFMSFKLPVMIIERQYIHDHTFILSTKTFLRVAMNPRYSGTKMQITNLTFLV